MNDLKMCFELLSNKYLNNNDIDYKIEKKETEYENLISKDKLLFMLIYGIKNNSFDNKENVLNFIEKIRSSKVPTTISEYLYNYLYQNPEFKKIDLKFKNNKLYFLGAKNKKILVYSIIQLDNRVGDLKVTSIKIKLHKEFFEIQKTILFSLDSAIDLVVLNGENKSCLYNEQKLIEETEKVLKDKKFVKMGLIIPSNQKVYDSIGLNLDNTISYLDDGILKEYDGDLKKVRKVNLSKYTKKNYDNLEIIDLGKNFLNNENMEVFNDKDIMYFISDLNKASINKENSSRKR